MSHDRHKRFLLELEQKGTVIEALKDRQLEVFKEEYSVYLGGFKDTEIGKLYRTLPNSSFLDDKSTYEKCSNAGREYAQRTGEISFVDYVGGNDGYKESI